MSSRPPVRAVLLGLLGLWGLVATACAGCRTHPAAPAAAPYVILRPSGGELRVAVELARDSRERALGLMHRTSLADGRGMLFLFPHPEPLKFWMRNTLIPLDMVFMDADRRIVFIEENAAPLTENERGPDGESQYVLEVPGGWCRAHGVAPGQVAEFVNVPLESQ